jgi:hypothetical protein
MDPWNDEMTMLKSKSLNIVAEREKMPFEVTPFVIYLSREQSRVKQQEAPAVAAESKAPAVAAESKAPAVAAESNADPGAVPGDPGASVADPK